MLLRIARQPHRSIFNELFDVENPLDTMYPFIGDSAFLRHRSRPAVDVSEGDNESVVVMELPGVAKENLSVRIDDGQLTISGERKQVAIPDNAKWIRNETANGEFSRTISLPHPVDASKITAEMTDGILRIVLPKAEEARPKEIRIR